MPSLGRPEQEATARLQGQEGILRQPGAVAGDRPVRGRLHRPMTRMQNEAGFSNFAVVCTRVHWTEQRAGGFLGGQRHTTTPYVVSHHPTTWTSAPTGQRGLKTVPSPASRPASGHSGSPPRTPPTATPVWNDLFARAGEYQLSEGTFSTAGSGLCVCSSLTCCPTPGSAATRTDGHRPSPQQRGRPGARAVALSVGKHLPAVVLRPERTVGHLSSDTRGESPWDAWLSHISQRQVRFLMSICGNRPAGSPARRPAEPHGPELRASAECGALGGAGGLRRETGMAPALRNRGAGAEKTRSAPLGRFVSPP